MATPAPDEVKPLIRQAKAGDSEAFCRIVALYQSLIQGYIARFVMDSDDAFDLAQETFVTAYRRIGTFEEGRSFTAWLRGIAKNETLAYMRKTSRRRNREHRVAEEAVWQWQQERLTRGRAAGSDKLDALRHCVAKLREQDKRGHRMLTMRYFQELAVAEISRQIAVKQGAIRVALMRLRQALRKCVAAQLAREGTEYA